MALAPNEADATGSLKGRQTLWRRALRFFVLRLAFYPLAFAFINVPALLLARWIHLADIMVNFQPFYLIAALVSLGCTVALRRWRYALAAAVLALIPAALIVPYYVPQTAHAAAGGAELTVMSANLFGNNADFQWFIDYAVHADADVMLIQEYTPQAHQQLSKALPAWPHRNVYVEPDFLGQAIYSKYPLVDWEIAWLASRTFPTLTAIIEVGGHQLTLIDSHPVPPGNARDGEHRNRELSKIVTLLPDDGLTILGGDLNTTMWSPFYRDMLRSTGLREARRGFGVHGTWPVFYWPCMIPLDHVLVSPGIGVESFEVALGKSDHGSVLVRLRLPESD